MGSGGIGFVLNVPMILLAVLALAGLAWFLLRR
jgi:hypothetical protein